MSRYHKLPIAQKRTEALTRIREPAVTCPSCDTQVMPSDLVAHVDDRCKGPREPGPGAKWISWREAVAMGEPPAAISRWVNSGIVRIRGPQKNRQYLERDLAWQVAMRRIERRWIGEKSRRRIR